MIKFYVVNECVEYFPKPVVLDWFLPECSVFTRALAGLVLLSVLVIGLEKEGKVHSICFK